MSLINFDRADNLYFWSLNRNAANKHMSDQNDMVEMAHSYFAWW